MREHRAKKSFGQNFLKSETALRKIVAAGKIHPEDVILEIGPGRGALTEKLLASRCKVLAVEKDRGLVEFLQEKFAEEIKSRSLVLVHGDILEFKVESHKVKSYKVIANIPYNITGAILKKFLGGNQPPSAQGYGGAMPERMVLMLQHEVAQRIVGSCPPLGGGSGEVGKKHGKESILSMSVKAYGEPKLIMKVPKRYFSPEPKVDSAIIAITNISRRNFTHLTPPSAPLSLSRRGDGGEVHPPRPGGHRGTPQEGNLEARFWRIVRAGFAHKRKKLSSNLKNICQGESLTRLGNKRAEDLTLEDWFSLARQ